MNNYQIGLVIFIFITHIFLLGFLAKIEEYGFEDKESIKVFLGWCIYILIASCAYFYLGIQ